jgi:hypothetical protein
MLDPWYAKPPAAVHGVELERFRDQAKTCTLDDGAARQRILQMSHGVSSIS